MLAGLAVAWQESELLRGSFADSVEIDIVAWSIPFFIVLMLLEGVVLVRESRMEAEQDEVVAAEKRKLSSESSKASGYTSKDTVASLTMGVGSLIIPILVTTLLSIGGYVAVWNLSPFDLGNGWVAWVAAFFLKDIAYYWWHRVSHEVRIMWAAHVIHHSSQKYNLSTALRQCWTPLTDWPFSAVVIFLGVNPAIFITMSGINLVYQFWIHTEAIGKLPRPIEYVWNTPSHHRVHHGINFQYLDKNYAGVLIIWDRLFGTFEPEVERVRYGITKQLDTFNPLKIATHEYASIMRDIRSDTSWRHRAARLLRGPGWSPPVSVDA